MNLDELREIVSHLDAAEKIAVGDPETYSPDVRKAAYHLENSALYFRKRLHDVEWAILNHQFARRTHV